MRTALVTAFLLMTLLTAAAQDGFSIAPITDGIFERMQGGSYPAQCTVPRTDLRYLTVKHYDARGNECRGELVCHKSIARDLIDIFRQLYFAHYPIERMRLIDDYDADDEQSMQHNNTSCFCFRNVAGSSKPSKHAMGLAIDINPLYNPYIKGTRVRPANAKRYCDRSLDFDYKISRNDLCHQLFAKHGFRWGGDWHSLKDYQHFEK